MSVRCKENLPGGEGRICVVRMLARYRIADLGQLPIVGH